MLKLVIVILLFALPAPAMTRDEFQRLAEDLAPKVNLFHDIWATDHRAELAAGTTRDFLYWVKGELRKGRTPEDLRALPRIDVRDFIVADSDVDVYVWNPLRVDERNYGIRRFDVLRWNENPDDLFDQGFLPVENIRLKQSGFSSDPRFGDGIGEIFAGRPTLHPPDFEKFPKTRYAAMGLNHEVLLGLRYLRIVALNYFHHHGRAHPGPELLTDIDPASAAIARALIAKALRPGELLPFMRRPKFAEWINGTIRKGFRAYTSPSAAMALYRYFGADQLPNVHHDIAPINQFLFAKPEIVEATLRERLAAFDSTPERLYVDPAQEFPDATLYHGTKKEDAFEAILRQGVLPSSDGTAGGGLYGVRHDNLDFAIEWGGSRDRLVKFRVKPGARIVDITTGEGRRVFEKFNRGADVFAEHFGVDILCYPYPTRAYVVKNSESLERPRGVTRQVLTYSKVLEIAEDADTFEKARMLFESMHLSQFTTAEIAEAAKRMPVFAAERFRTVLPLLPTLKPQQLSLTLEHLGSTGALSTGLSLAKIDYVGSPNYRTFLAHWLVAIGQDDPAAVEQTLAAVYAPVSRRTAWRTAPRGTVEKFREFLRTPSGGDALHMWLMLGGMSVFFAGFTWADHASTGNITVPFVEVLFAGCLYLTWGAMTVFGIPLMVFASFVDHMVDFADPRAAVKELRTLCRAGFAGLAPPHP